MTDTHTPQDYRFRVECARWRTTRTTHRCYHCRLPIAPRERAVEYYGEAPAFQTGHYYHADCAVEARLIEARLIEES